MSGMDKEIVKEFVVESKTLIAQLLQILETADGDFTKVKSLEDYGQTVDRIMGGAKNLAIMAPPEHALHMVADYAALCKAVGYKSSQISDNEQFYNICIGLLLDATETLDQLVTEDRLEMSVEQLRKTWSDTFLERLRWVSNEFTAEYRASVDAKPGAKLDQSEIDELMKKLGFG